MSSVIGQYLNKKAGWKKSDKYYFHVFFMPLSELLFKHYRQTRGIGHIRDVLIKYPRQEPDVSEEIAKIASTKDVVSLHFFHRHPDYKAAFSRTSDVEELQKPANYLKDWLPEDFDFFSRQVAPEIDTSLYECDRFTATLFDAELHKCIDQLRFPKIFLTNAHGLYHSTLMSLFVASAVDKGTRLYINQPGFLHSFISYFHQVAFEASICTKYLSWSPQNANIPVDKLSVFGCFYRKRKQVKTAEPEVASTLIVLPQRSSRTMPCAMYYGENSSFSDDYLSDIIKSIHDNMDKLGSSVVLRCKSVDVDFFQRILTELGSHVPLESGDINTTEGQYQNHYRIITTYPSTSMIESLDKSTESFFVFDERSISCNTEFKKQLAHCPHYFASFDDFDAMQFSQKAAVDFVERNAVLLSPEEAATRLYDLIMEQGL
ncbi:hypothetical protein [Aestuariibacter salexigens]|uniref:hypothetical protein n=1 Tax=Aestuariibacter salexigens TaxID=226010 RepID=UPI000429118B|nr:hypothetical protein [Aestuariibacter salexigens]